MLLYVSVQEFNSHSEELDKERVTQIMEGAVRDVQWLVNKYARDRK